MSLWSCFIVIVIVIGGDGVGGGIIVITWSFLRGLVWFPSISNQRW